MKKIIIVAVCLIIAALSIYKISGYLLEMLESQNLNDSLTKEAVMKLPQDAESNQSEQESVQETAPIIVDFEVLQTENKDIIAWLHCPDTKINYPVAQSEDNQSCPHCSFGYRRPSFRICSYSSSHPSKLFNIIAESFCRAFRVSSASS